MIFFFLLFFRSSCGLESNSFIHSIDSEDEIRWELHADLFGNVAIFRERRKESNGKIKREISAWRSVTGDTLLLRLIEGC